MTMISKLKHTSNETIEKLQCIHCGDKCGSSKVSDNEMLFCCVGCKTVYTLLNQSGLENYYSLEKRPGLKPEFTIIMNL